MFKPTTDRIKELVAAYPERIQGLEKIFDKKTNMQRGPLARSPSSGKLTDKVIYRLSDSIGKSSAQVCINLLRQTAPI